MTKEGVVGGGATDDHGLAPKGVDLGVVQSLFPLPRFGDLRRGHSRIRGGRRQNHSDHLRRGLDETVVALNSLSFVGERVQEEVTSFTSDLQEKAHARLRKLVTMHQPQTAIPSTQAAFQELLRGRAVYGDSAVNPNLATFSSVARVSMPTSLAGSPYLNDVLPHDQLHHLEGSLQRMLRDTHEFEAVRDQGGLPEPYWDPMLRKSRRKYIQLMRALLRLGLVRALPRGSGKERTSISL